MMGFPVGQGAGNKLSNLSGSGHCEFDHIPMSIWETQIQIGVFLFLLFIF